MRVCDKSGGGGAELPCDDIKGAGTGYWLGNRDVYMLL